MDKLNIVPDFLSIINKAKDAGPEQLRLLRKTVIGFVKVIGAKNFVTMAAEVLKNNLCIEGCNDVRMPLKRIFSITLEELEENLSTQKYDLSKGHPLIMLSNDHKENIKKLKALRFSFGLKQVQDYYLELDLHIREEEEVFFPVLEKNGMQEHPENLRQEHKGFREILSRIIEALKNVSPGEAELVLEETRNLKEKFISDISNHVFRETYVFYPAALEFIKDKQEWEEIRSKFTLIHA